MMKGPVMALTEHEVVQGQRWRAWEIFYRATRMLELD